ENMLLSNLKAGLSTEPDAMFASWDTMREGRVRLVGPRPKQPVDVEGTPDMVLEVISRSSVRKDTVVLPELYLKAGIPEYWLVDPRGGMVRFDILRRTASGYRRVREQNGWRKSRVFDAAFRLVQSTDPLGDPAFRLDVE